MTDSGTSGVPGADAPGRRDAEEQQEGRILFKDNRRIDPKTGQARKSGDSADPAADSASDSAGLPQPGSPGANPSDSANAEQPVTATVLAGSEELEAARTEAAERTADLQRVTAEYANYRKRVERDKQAATQSGKASVVTELLGVLDDLERAEQHGDLTGGFKNVADKLTGTLQRLGLEHYGAEGDEFDPNVHEAVQFATSADVEHPTVTSVLRLGYRFAERVLRPAVVIVTGPEHEVTEAEGETADSVADSADADADADDAEAPTADSSESEEQ